MNKAVSQYSNMKHNIILTYQLCLQEGGLAREKTTYKYTGDIILRVSFKVLIHQYGEKWHIQYKLTDSSHSAPEMSPLPRREAVVNEVDDERRIALMAM